MSLLDIGGGFPGSEVSAKTGVPFDEIAEVSMLNKPLLLGQGSLTEGKGSVPLTSLY